MNNPKFPKVNTLQIQYFIEVVERGSYTKAAEQLYTTQSTLSKMILSMEESLGVRLFLRNHKRLQLTEAGNHLYKKWKTILLEMENSVEESRVLQGGHTQMLTIGFLDSHDPEKFAMPFIRQFAQTNPSIFLSIQSCPAQEIRQQLLSGNLDLAYTVLYDVEQLGSNMLHSHDVNTCPHNVCMLASNPLAEKEYLEIEDLKNSTFVSISPLYTPSYSGMIEDLCRKAGFRPHFARYTNSATSLPYNLFSDTDIFLCDRNYRGYKQPSFSSLEFRPLIHTQSGIAAIWQKSNPKPELQLYISQVFRDYSE